MSRPFRAAVSCWLSCWSAMGGPTKGPRGQGGWTWAYSYRMDGWLIIELDDGKIYRKTLYLMVKTMISCKFSLKPIQWIKRQHWWSKHQKWDPSEKNRWLVTHVAISPKKNGDFGFFGLTKKVIQPATMVLDQTQGTSTNTWGSI